jgi:hypothetical protein
VEYDSTQQTVSWFLQRNREDSLLLNPPFQRRPVWTRRQQSHLIESVLMGLPIPEIYMQHKTTPDGRTKYIVVDGQQRIRAVLEFIGTDGEEGFELQFLSEDSPWRNRSFQGLTEDERTTFFGRRLAVRELHHATDEEVKDMFRRLNKYLTKLSPQELRNATYSGPFVKLAETVAESPYWAENRLVSAQSIRRMGDIEFASELLIGVMHGPQGGSARAIDEYYEQYEEYEDEIPDQAAVRRLFSRTLDAIQEVLPEIKTTRWHNKTDFYTLFVATAHLLRDHLLPDRKVRALRRALTEFASQIDTRLKDEHAEVAEAAVRYVRAVEKGSSEKARRAARHQAMLEVISDHFKPRRR